MYNINQIKTNTLVSVIIPTYNSEDRILETLESVSKPTYSHNEIIVVDDGSYDNTLNKVKNFNKKAPITIVIRQRYPKGASTCRNIGSELSNGDFL